jgi:radical SAM protein with 4Fe4S-binding SPASM domain
MIREDFMELLQYLRSNYDGKIVLATNGVLIKEDNVKELSRLIDRIDISIDGIDEITCSSIRGKGVFDKVISSIGLLQKNCFNEIYLSMVFGDFNQELKEKFKELNRKLGTHSVIREFVPIGRGKENAQIFSKAKNMVVDVNFSKDELLEARKNCIGIRCGAGITDLVVNYDGIVYPCANLMGEKYALFDIKVILDITDFLRNQYKKTVGYEAVNNIQPNNYKKCKDCKINLFCWTCLQDIEMLDSDPEAFEKRCKLKKQILYPIIWE